MLRFIASKPVSTKPAETGGRATSGNRGPRRRSEEREFLPAALEILDTPASPTARAAAATIVAFLVAALIWASVGTVDIVATAPGRIIPGGKTKVVQPFEGGIINAIHVNEGQAVKAGDLLVELDPTINAAEERRLSGDFLQDRLDVARLDALAVGNINAFAPPDGADPELVSVARRRMDVQSAEHDAKMESFDRLVAQKRAEEAEAAAATDKIKAVLPLLEQQRDIRAELFRRELGSRLLYLQAEQAVVEQQHELLVLRQRRDGALQALASLDRQRAQAAAEYRKGVLEDLARSKASAAEHGAEMAKAAQRRGLQSLTAPVDGTVQQIAVHTIGGVVTPGQILMVIVPRDSRLEIEALVANRDIGFVHAGQTAEIKVDAFNFTHYGLVAGRVSGLSSDAIVPDGENKRAGMERNVTEDTGNDYAYSARVSINKSSMIIDGRDVELKPGMSVVVEINTGKRHVINYILSPLLKTLSESFDER
ncbi:MAG: HlyD family type I secretion periplasmic adaptor subunit [Telmatospirillum sp.]|nr:HlyD family type I secretion periplasmic adaptor subunit [Telmatospirillum sp.]